MRKHLTAVLTYFAYFSYAPTFSEIYTFFPVKITRKDLQRLLINGYKRGKLLKLPKNMSFRAYRSSILNYNLVRPERIEFPRYTLPQYSIKIKNKSIRQLVDQIQIQNKWRTLTVQIYLFILKHLSFVRFVGVTGATAMNGYSPSDDIDLFIIARKGTLWTARFFVVVLAKLLHIYGGVGICLNLFFDEQDLIIPLKKQNEYIAHELLQMKPVIDKNDAYSLLIQANEWIFTYFPNTPSVIPAPCLPAGRKARIQDDWIPSSEGMTQKIDLFFKSIQLPIIKKNKTGFRITDHQLWLFKRDFEIKLKRNGLGR